MFKCLKCEHEWIPRTDNPLSCPKCKSRNWDLDGYNKCEICNRNFLRLITHHKDGNPQNNKEHNKIRICDDCHRFIHNPLKKHGNKQYLSRTRRYDKTGEIRKKLIQLNNHWNKSKKIKSQNIDQKISKMKKLRNEGNSYQKIAKILNTNISTVRYYLIEGEKEKRKNYQTRWWRK